MVESDGDLDLRLEVARLLDRETFADHEPQRRLLKLLAEETCKGGAPLTEVELAARWMPDTDQSHAIERLREDTVRLKRLLDLDYGTRLQKRPPLRMKQVRIHIPANYLPVDVVLSPWVTSSWWIHL